jgi:hypothetical protein
MIDDSRRPATLLKRALDDHQEAITIESQAITGRPQVITALATSTIAKLAYCLDAYQLRTRQNISQSAEQNIIIYQALTEHYEHMILSCTKIV